MTAAGPPTGIRVIEVGTMLAGPYATLLLADLGAKVVKIEPPGGEISRTVGESYFASLNRNKSGLCLDLNSEVGQHRLAELAADSDALVVNLRPSSIRRLGLTYEALRRFNERIVCVAITGYGLHGGDDPAFDYVIQAAAGSAALTGEPGGPPTLPGYSSADNSTGMCAALVAHRDRCGIGYALTGQDVAVGHLAVVKSVVDQHCRAALREAGQAGPAVAGLAVERRVQPRSSCAFQQGLARHQRHRCPPTVEVDRHHARFRHDRPSCAPTDVLAFFSIENTILIRK